jgi:PKD repeat protein
VKIKNSIKLTFLIVAILICSITISNLTSTLSSGSTLSVTAASIKKSYYVREPATINGSILLDGQPANNAIVAIEVRNNKGDPFIQRCIPIGNPSITWALNIKQVYMKDASGNPTNTTMINKLANIYATIENKMLNEVYAVVALSVFDGNLIPIYTGWHEATFASGSTQTFSWSVYIPEWAYSGIALAFINVYSDYPRNGGTPQAPEALYRFHITRNPEVKYPTSQPPQTFSSKPGSFELYFRIPPDKYTLPGNYTFHVVAMTSAVTKAYTSSSFNVDPSPCPPQAAFTYYPLTIYANMTITFDASSSSAEGYGDYITKYTWKINIPNNPVIISKTTPTLMYAIVNPGTYIVELNVTDSQGLWSTTSKPVKVQPEFGPTAYFTWSPTTPNIAQNVTFDASQSKPGWSAKIANYAPITSYIWNFGDGTTNTTTSPTIVHSFLTSGSFTVTLTVVDSVGRAASTSNTIQVSNVTVKMYDLTKDGKIDMRDVAIVARAFGSTPGSPNWNPIADINGDGKVDMKDVAPVARNFGKDP